jgi:sterol desaturase/sphingolipid hydroxylase (fatty acid hydroxylase superfamily)
MDHKSYFFYVSVIALRYFLGAGLFFCLFYYLLRDKVSKLKLQKDFPKNKMYFFEIGHSSLTFLIFAGYAFLIFQTPLEQHTTLYFDISLYGIPYFLCSILVVVFLHDTYFYWTHRIMHHPRLFKYFHLVHHNSTNPSPWAAYSFHPLEGLVEGGFFLLVVFLIPIHPYSLLLFTLFTLLFNIYGHLGYEIIPKKILTSKLGKWINTSTSHNMHHKYFTGNYSLYFRFWDIVMKTTHKKYNERVERLKF